MGFGAKVKDVLGFSPEVKIGEFIKPACGYTCANITLGGAGYPINMYHQQFLVYVEGLNTEQAGRISLINGLWDAFNDPVMGIIADRTRSKYGRHRPYLLVGVLPFAIAYVMKWFSFGVSAGGNTGSTWLWYLFAAMMYSTSYTIMSIPHTAMLPSICPDYFMRTQYKIVEYMMNSIGQVSSWVFTALALSNFDVKVALTALPNPVPEDRSKYMIIGIILAVYFIWPPVCTFFKTHEEPSYLQKRESVNLKYMIHEYKLIFMNKSFRQYFFITLFFSMSKSFYSITDQYFMISVADKYKYFNSLNIISGISEFIGSPLNYLIVRYKGKAACGKYLGPLMVCGLFLNIFITPGMSSKAITAIIFISSMFYNFGFSGPGFVGDNIQPDITDVDELITGRRREGVVATFKSLFAKTISSFMSYAVGFSLKVLFGYNEKKPLPSQQSSLSILGLRLNFIILPSVLALLCVISIYKYKMTKADHAYIKELIALRHKNGHVDVPLENRARLELISGVNWEDMWISSISAAEETVSE